MRMKTISSLLIIISLLGFTNGYSQANNLTGSPYSLFGLGNEGNSNVGKNTGLGKSGIASDIESNINIYNSALFATIPKNRFLFDIGFTGEINYISNGKDNEYRGASNFSSVSIAFNPNGKYGMGFTLMPATNVGYALIGVETEIEGSEQSYISNINGLGGLNTLRFDYGRSMSEKLNIGVNLSYLFGKIEENEMIILSNSQLKINKANYYSGVQFGLGLQLRQKNYNLGFVFDSPVLLSAYKDTHTTKNSDSDVLIVDKILNESIDDFILPMELKFGISTTVIKKLALSLDYKRRFWDMTDQSDNIGHYTDQNVVGIGVEYVNNKNSFKYWKRINFRAGYNFDSGYLEIDHRKISNNSFSLGLGFPLGHNNLTHLNFSYTYGKSGTTKGILVEQNFNTININLSLSDIWFQKRKYN